MVPKFLDFFETMSLRVYHLLEDPFNLSLVLVQQFFQSLEASKDHLREKPVKSPVFAMEKQPLLLNNLLERLLLRD